MSNERREAATDIERRSVVQMLKEAYDHRGFDPTLTEQRAESLLAAYDQALSEQPQSTKASSDDA